MIKGIYLENITPEELRVMIREEIAAAKISNTQEENQLLTRMEALKLLNISPSTLDRWQKNKIVKPIQKGRRTYFMKNELLESGNLKIKTPR